MRSALHREEVSGLPPIYPWFRASLSLLARREVVINTKILEIGVINTIILNYEVLLAILYCVRSSGSIAMLLEGLGSVGSKEEMYRQIW